MVVINLIIINNLIKLGLCTKKHTRKTCYILILILFWKKKENFDGKNFTTNNLEEEFLTYGIYHLNRKATNSNYLNSIEFVDRQNKKKHHCFLSIFNK
jgi:hypothetical protein